MNITEYSNKGSRTVNQDYIIHRSLSADSAIFVLADGMGGYSHGEIAAQTVATKIVSFIEKNMTNYSPEDLIRESIAFANDAFMVKRMELGGKKMGTVIAVLLILNSQAYIAWLGDSRVYKYSDGEMKICTTDHSMVQQLSAKVNITPSIYEKYGAIVTRAVMGDELKDEIPIKVVSAQKNDVFLLCSDGFHKQLPVEEYMASSDNTNLKCLNDMASDMDDNYSFIKVEL